MTDKICVYFNNDYRAVFNREDVLILCAPKNVGAIDPAKLADKTAVNWTNVCFIRPYEEKEEDEP